MRLLRKIVPFLILAHTGFALPADKTQPVNLKANSADLNQQTHHGVYMGDVEFDQGTTHLRAAMATTEGNEKNQLTKAVATGNKENQAHYWTLTALNKPPMHAFADTIYYYAARHLILLTGNARIEQGDNSFAAPNIRYDTLHQHVITKRVGDHRTTIIIHPGDAHG